MERIFTYTIDSSTAGQKLGDFLRTFGFTHHILRHIKETENGILLNGHPAFLTVRLNEGDFIRVRLLEETSTEVLIPTRLPFQIVYEDEDLIVINKPANMPIHPSFQNHGNTLADALAWYFQEKGQSFVYRCINRLDRDTTGLLIVAKHMLSAAILSAMMVERTIHRTYLALVEGLPPEYGIIDAPIGRTADSAMLREVNYETGESAVTHFHRLDSRNGLSLIQCKLETGRTHQIRVHMKHLGYPLIGDYLYNPDYSRMNRQSLHSYRLSFTHPITGIPMNFELPLPDDMKKAFEME